MSKFREQIRTDGLRQCTDILRGFDCEPVQAVVTTGPSGVLIGTSGVVVSPLKLLKDT